MDKVIIVGNGIAAVSAIEAFRKHDEETPITVISDEPYCAYYRTRLSSLLGDNPDINKLYIHQPDWYKKNNVDIRLNTKVISIDPTEKTITLKEGEKITYTKLLISTGSRPFVPPVSGTNLPGVFSIRSFSDVKNFYDFCKDKTHGVIVGGGVLGLEAAWTLAKNGKRLTVIEGSPYILSKQLDKTSSSLLTVLGKEAGINFLTNNRLSQVNGNDTISSVILKDGREIPAEFVIFSTGIRSNIEPVNSTSIMTNRGIIVDEYMQTSQRDIYAAGDLAEYKHQIYGIWPVAKEQGKTAGLNMAGIPTPYKEIIPSNYIKIFDIEIFSMGDLGTEEKAERVITNYQPEQNIYQAVFFKDFTPVGAILFGDTKPAMKISKAIKSKIRILENMDFDSFISKI